MLYDMAHFWVALTVAVGLGVAVGWFTLSAEPRRGPVLVIGKGWIFWGAVIALVGLVLALIHALPDRPGLWLETALLLFVAYLVGCPLPGLLFAGADSPSAARGSSATAPVRSPAAGEVAGTSAGVTATRSVAVPAASATHAGPLIEPLADPVSHPVAKPVGAVDKELRPTRASPTGIISDDPDAVDRPKR